MGLGLRFQNLNGVNHLNVRINVRDGRMALLVAHGVVANDRLVTEFLEFIRFPCRAVSLPVIATIPEDINILWDVATRIFEEDGLLGNGFAVFDKLPSFVFLKVFDKIATHHDIKRFRHEDVTNLACVVLHNHVRYIGFNVTKIFFEYIHTDAYLRRDIFCLERKPTTDVEYRDNLSLLPRPEVRASEYFWQRILRPIFFRHETMLGLVTVRPV